MIDTERALLGAVLMDPVCLASAATALTPADFATPAHRYVYDAMLSLSAKGTPIDIVTVKAKLASGGKLEAAGGAEYLAALLDGVPRMDNVDSYAKLIRDTATMKLLSDATGSIKEAATGDDVDAAVDRAMEAVLKVAARAQGIESFASPDLVAKRTMALIDKMTQTPDGVTGIRTGLLELDEMTGGLQKEQLIILAARPGMGKTAAAMNWGDHVARQGGVVGYFSLEMSAEELTQRRFASAAKVNLKSLRFHSATCPEKCRACDGTRALAKAYGTISVDAFRIDAQAGLSINQIRARARRLKAEAGRLDLVIVDYLQLIHAEWRGNREQVIAEIARGLKDLAKELKIPVLALSQLSRECEKRDNKRPQLSDLRESGEIEQAADIVMFVYRDCVYNPQADPKSADLLIRKHRAGSNFDMNLEYHAEITTFKEKARGIAA